MDPSTSVGGAAVAPAATRVRARAFGRETFEGYFFLAPALLILTVFLVVPTIWVLGLSLFKWDFVGDPVFVGLRNYGRLITTDELFHKALWQTVYFVLGTVPTGIALSLFIAVLLNARVPARGFLRAVIYSPYVMPVVATTVLWQWIFNADYGLANAVLGVFHLPKLGWIRSPQWIMPAIIVYSLWHYTGYNVVIFLAGLANIPPELEEAARVDGAGRWHVFRHVTWPLLTPTTYFVLFVSLISSFKVFTQIYQFTTHSGGPDLAAVTIGFYLYQEAFQYQRAGYASAISVVLFLIIVLVTLFQIRFASRRVFYR